MIRNDTYVITGASGNIGRVLTECLLRNGRKVRVIGRYRERLQPLIDLGAQASFGSLEETDFLTEAFHGAASVFAMIPPNLSASNLRGSQGEISDSLIQAIQSAGVTHAVALSSIGADLERDTGPIKGLFDFERKLEKLRDVNVLILRPAFFMENLLQGIPAIRLMNANGGALRADVSIPMIATRDIGTYAAGAMEDASFSGLRVDFLPGPADLNMQDVTRVIGKAIGKNELEYIQLPDGQIKQALTSSGASESVISAYMEMAAWINANGMAYLDRESGITTPTTIDEYAKTFAAVYKNGEQLAAGNHS